MDLERRLELITRPPTEEVITLDELRALLEVEEHPVAYDGFEPSGLAHLPFGVLRAIKLQDMLEAGCRFKLLLADWHAMINNKMGGDLEKIRKVGEYFIEVWKAAGVNLSRVEIVWANDLVNSRDYWKYVIQVAKNISLKRALRALPIMGRREEEMQEAAQIIYPAMQVSDIFYMGIDICQLGLDQRRANILARELAPKLGVKKPVAVHHHMLMGLQGPIELKGFEEDVEMNLEIASKMSKSIPETSIFVHDDYETLKSKIDKAYCPPRSSRGNPILEYAKYIIFRMMKSLYVERPSKYGGDIEYWSYEELERDYVEGKLHPADLKNAVSRALDEIIKPIREHFEKDPNAKRLYEIVRSLEITR
ncbi:MAG: tyrosine--tRNA ligase [Nitrososphaeria archaeon]|nr:tyrosine--tRNA ligase [Nitrososphaeria archaeon]MDW7986943.1 tyrosine--tRNA ligase [Nitrososphaerota archaeon]